MRLRENLEWRAAVLASQSCEDRSADTSPGDRQNWIDSYIALQFNYSISDILLRLESAVQSM